MVGNTENFETYVKEAMDEIVKSHQHDHPLYQETRIVKEIIDKNRKKAAFVLFEQIDTDRCTPEGEGWLGDQFRYSVWYIDGSNKPKQLHEDHAYWRASTSAVTGSQGRDCSIYLLELLDDGVIAKVVPEDAKDSKRLTTKVKITLDGKVEEARSEEKFDVPKDVKKYIIDVLSSWSDARGDAHNSDNSGRYSSHGRSQITSVLKNVKAEDFINASDAYRGACADLYDAGYNWKDTCDGGMYTLLDLDVVINAIREIAKGKSISMKYFKK